jgi:hypothetical protein
MDWYRVIKKINGHPYYYYQKTYRVGRQVKTLNKYGGPVDKVPRPAARLAYAPKGSINAGMKKKNKTQRHIQRFSDPLDLHENHTFSNTCPVCMNAHEHASSVNATMTPNKDSDLETGAQLYGCIPELNKMPPELRDTLYRVVQLAIKLPQYDTFAVHLLHPRNGLFSSFGQLLTFSRKLTSQENINGDHVAELFKVLHMNAGELQPEFSSCSVPSVNASTRRKLHDHQIREIAEEKLLDAHLQAIADRNADAFNIGAHKGDRSIMSKTDKGSVTSTATPSGKITHVWNARK